MKMMKQRQGKKMIQVEEGREQKQWGQDGGCFVARSRPSGEMVCLVRRAPVESLSQKAARLLYQGAAPAQLRTASSRGLQSLIGHRFFALYRLLQLVWVWVLHFCKTLRPIFSLIGHQLGTVQGLRRAAVGLRRAAVAVGPAVGRKNKRQTFDDRLPLSQVARYNTRVALNFGISCM